jgi:hypothetical protein
MKREDPWCETANLGKPGHAIGVLTNGSAVKPTCGCVNILYQVPNASKLRVDLRLFADLVAVGIFTEKEGLPVLANQLTLLTANDRDEHNNLPIVLIFSKHCGDDYAGLVPRKFRYDP